MRSALQFTAAALAALALAGSASADSLLNEGFDSFSTLAGSGWVMKNNSSSPNALTTAWFQGNPGIFAADSGATNSYAGSNFAVSNTGAVSAWLITPEISLSQNVLFNFSLRLLGEGFLDTVQVYWSNNAGSSNVGSTPTSTGDFQLLATYTADSDTGWVDESMMLGGLGGTASGRFAFRYVVSDVSTAGDYVGLDNVRANSVPEPGSIALVGLGLAGAAFARRRKA